MKRIALLAVLLLAARCASAQTYGRIPFHLQNAQGQAISGAIVNVYTQPACGQPSTGILAQLFSSSTGGTVNQPATTSGLGQGGAYAAPGCYTVVYSSPYTGTVTDIDQLVIAGGLCSTGGCAFTGPLTGQQINNIFYADGFPSSCNIGGVGYTTQLDCAWYTALATVATAASNPTVIVGSGSTTNYSTCAGLPVIPAGYTGNFSVNLIGMSRNPTTFGAVASITQTCSISTGTVSLPVVVGSHSKSLTITGVSLNANLLAPYAMQILGGNYGSNFDNLVFNGATVTPVLIGVFADHNNWTFHPKADNWTVLNYCTVTNGCGSGATGTVALSGGVPTVTVTAGGTKYDSNTIATLVGYRSGISNQPCTSMGTTTATVSGGAVTAISSTATGCSGTVYVQITDGGTQYGIDIEGMSDTSSISGWDIETGSTAGLYLGDAGTSTFYSIHPWGGGLYGVLENFAGNTFVGTNCGEVSLACFAIKSSASGGLTTITGTMYHSNNQYQGFALYRTDSVTAGFDIHGSRCQGTQTAEYHTLVSTGGVYDGIGGVIGTSTIDNADYCGTGSGTNISASSQPVALLNATNQVSHALVFVYNGNPFLSCVATSPAGATSAPTLSGSVLTFYGDGAHNGGAVTCSDQTGAEYVQSVPNTGGTSQTFDLATQFATTSTSWIEVGGNFITLNSPSVFIQNGTLAKGVGGAVNADTVGGLASTGGGAAIPTGPIASTNGDAVLYSGTAGKIADAGFPPVATGFLKVSIPGTISSTGTGDTLPPLAQAITIVSASAYVFTPPSGCATFPVVTLWDVTAASAVATVTLAAATNQYTMTINSASVPAAHVLAYRTTTAPVTCGTNASQVIVNAQYH